jgi:hypothetical protein
MSAGSFRKFSETTSKKQMSASSSEVGLNLNYRKIVEVFLFKICQQFIFGSILKLMGRINNKTVAKPLIHR